MVRQEAAMMSEIYKRGPIVCSVDTPEDFTYGYRGGIYKDPLNYTREEIDHNVEVCAAAPCCHTHTYTATPAYYSN
jgi:hypothetical protein